MIRKIFKLLIKSPDYFLLSGATFLSGIGVALTTIAIYAELNRHQVSPLYYSAAFVVAFLPGLFTSQMSGKISHRISLSKAMIAAEGIGAVSLLFPVFAMKTNILWLLLVAEFVGSAIVGFLAPVHQSFLRRKFSDDTLKVVNVYSVYIFSANFIFGQALGTLFYAYFGTFNYLLIDFVTYIFAALLIFAASSKYPESFKPLREKGSHHSPFLWKKLSSVQKRAFLLNPILGLCCAPAMSLLPAAGSQYGVHIFIGSVVLSPVLVFLLLKTLGQMVGPYVADRFDFDQLIRSELLIVGCVALYLGLYGVIFSTRNFIVACVCIVAAHISSNIIFIIGSYGFTKSFDKNDIGSASARHYQVMVIIMTFSGLWAGTLAEHAGLVAVVLATSPLLIVTAFYLYRNKLLPVGVTHEQPNSI